MTMFASAFRLCLCFFLDAGVWIRRKLALLQISVAALSDELVGGFSPCDLIAIVDRLLAFGYRGGLTGFGRVDRCANKRCTTCDEGDGRPTGHAQHNHPPTT
jgi:hypothetical protein